MNESAYTRNVHQRLPDHIYAWKINDNYQAGVPDAFYRNTRDGGICWIEYKFIKQLPKREDTVVKPNLSSSQIHWLKQAEDAGEKVRIIVGFQDQKRSRQVCGIIVDLKHSIEGMTVAHIRENLLNYDELAINIANYCKYK